MSKIGLWFFSGGTILALLAGFALNRHWGELLAVLLAAGLWLAAQLRGNSLALLATSLALAGVVILGALENMPAALVVLAWCSLLIAWDLAEFQRRLAYSQDDAMRRRLERKHWGKLLLIFGLGAGGALGVVSMQVTLLFAGVVVIGLLGLVILWGLTLLLARQTKAD